MDEWLSRRRARREAADFRARSEALTQAVANTLPTTRPVSILDLGTGTGSNIRYLAPRLPRPQRWLAVDRNAALLAELRTRNAGLNVGIDTRAMDLATLEPSLFAGLHLVTASALLDLVSDSWLQALAGHCAAARASALFTITYNGESSCDPTESEDDWVRDRLNRHQTLDKGLGGPAAGPDASDCAERAFADVGYTVRRDRSDWTLGPGDATMQRMLVDGWAEAATEMEPGRTAAIADWRTRRHAHIDAGRSRIVVGHNDLAAWLR